MTEYVLFCAKKDPLSPTFNEAVAKLKAIKDVTIKEAVDYTRASLILIDAAEEQLHEMKKDLPGWTIGLNNPY